MARSAIGLVVLVATLAVTVTQAAPATTVRGMLFRGPVSPVCVEVRPCAVPMASTTILFLRGGVPVARTTTSARGRFALRLAPGAYGLRLLRPAPLARLVPRAVRVPRSGAIWLRLDLDTGIRLSG